MTHVYVTYESFFSQSEFFKGSSHLIFTGKSSSLRHKHLHETCATHEMHPTPRFEDDDDDDDDEDDEDVHVNIRQESVVCHSLKFVADCSRQSREPVTSSQGDFLSKRGC